MTRLPPCRSAWSRFRAPELRSFVRRVELRVTSAAIFGVCLQAAGAVYVDLGQDQERTSFQTAVPYHDQLNIRSDVAIVYGIDPKLPERLATWRDRGYRVHVMTGVSWGNYQDYLYGRFDGVNHEDEAQTERSGKKISHGGDVYYMCPGENYGKFLCVGVRRALEAGAEAIHLEEPEFWVRGGYSEGFKREWKSFYGEEWQPPHASADAQWRASKLKYFLYRRALQQVFDFVQQWNRENGRHVRCYVPTHSLLNYAHWRIVSPESSLARLKGCDGYIAQVWTGTSRTANVYRGVRKERTFETAFLEYGSMQNLVRATQRTVWYLNDPVEDNPDHDWEDYRGNWESTLVASLLQPEVWRYEVMPWPDRIFRGAYRLRKGEEQRTGIPGDYATELQTVLRALNDMNQRSVHWEAGTERLGVVVSDSMMFQRGDPEPGDPHFSQFYGLAMPLLKRGMPVEPVQLENTPLPGCLKRYDLLLLSYHGMKPLTPDVHDALAAWVKTGGVLVCWDDDRDPYGNVREWWNSGANAFANPREHLFEKLGLKRDAAPGRHSVGRGNVWHEPGEPAALAKSRDGDKRLMEVLKEASKGSRVRWHEANHLLLQRGPYVIAAGLDESVEAPSRVLKGRFVNLFDAALPVLETVTLKPGSRWLLLDLDKVPGRDARVLAAGTAAMPVKSARGEFRFVVEGVAKTQANVLVRCPEAPRTVTIDGEPHTDYKHDAARGLLWIRFANEPRPREVRCAFRG